MTDFLSNRREFLTRIGRSLMLGTFIASAGYLASHNRIARTATCQGKEICGSCSRFSHCSLPGAEKIRNHGKQ